MDKGVLLRHYKQEEIQRQMTDHARDKEVGVKYSEGFGKRPDILNYPKEVIELALNGVTSFHCSEERWENPLHLNSELRKDELDELRTGWDLVLDIDCIDWTFSKLTAHLFIRALEKEGITAVSCKFSGNKGFHIGVPFEAFPKEIAGQKTKNLFPLGPQKISQYLLHTIANNFIKIEDDHLIFDDQYTFTLNQLRDKFGDKEFIIHQCSNCRNKIKLAEEDENEFICPKCDQISKSKEEFVQCEKCNILMQKVFRSSLCQCGGNQYSSVFNPLSLIEVDTVLISSRHLYRMPYSLHEKSGLASVVINPKKVMQFEKEQALPEKLILNNLKFLDREVGECGGRLLLQALDFEVKTDQKDYSEETFKGEEIKIESPIREELFPPCIKKMLAGMEDGRKRAVFCLINFLGKVGWQKKEIETYLLAWNKEKNKPPLRDNYVQSQLRYFSEDKLPPNCNNEGYYRAMGVKCDEPLCQKVKNPVNYTIRKWKWELRQKEEKEN